MTTLSLLDEAEQLARLAHHHQRRKGDGTIHYFDHLASVVTRLRSFGIADEVSLCAAYLHDLIEDQPEHTASLRSRFPEDVVQTVEALTEQKTDEAGKRRTKDERFAGYVRGLRDGSEAAKRAIPISCADKIDNIQSVLADERRGIQILTQLGTRPGQVIEQLRVLRDVYETAVPRPMIEAYDETTRQFLRYIREWLPGRALAIAATAHLGQRDRSGAPYAMHPLRVALRGRTEDEMMVGALHDVVEDTSWTLEQIAREGFSPDVVIAIDKLTRRDDESYEHFIERLLPNPLARQVKLFDLDDNMAPYRMAVASGDDLHKSIRHERARARILEAIAAEATARARHAARRLVVRLDDDSIARVRALAAYREVRGNHVTLARAHAEHPSLSWIPGGTDVGAPISFEASGICQDRGVQAIVVQMAGSSRRPWDGGVLHVTVSKRPPARSKDANALVVSSRVHALTMRLSGTIVWEP